MPSGWDRSLVIVCVYEQNSSTESLAILESLGEVLDTAPTGDSIVLLGDFDESTSAVSWICWQGENVGQTYRPKRIVRVCRERLTEPSIR